MVNFLCSFQGVKIRGKRERAEDNHIEFPVIIA